MNVLILTPGRTGSSLLQRVITIHMLHNDYNKPIVNLHDLLYGLNNNNPDHQDFNQSMSEVINILEEGDYHKVARVAYKGILKRNDSKEEQDNFYKYINDNFYVIRTERTDLLEFALSWIIVNHSKKRNVHSHEEKTDTFDDVDQIHVGKQNLFKMLNLYRDYIDWSDEHFNIQSHFNYEQSINDIEDYILGLNFIKETTWEDIFGISFKEWDTHHNKLSHDNVELYETAHAQIEEFVKDGILPTHLSVKLQSFDEKKAMIDNFDECVNWYKEWKELNP